MRKQNTGNFIEDESLTLINKFYQYQFSEGTEITELNPYSEVTYDAQGRVSKTAAPGKDWKIGSTHEVKTDYEFNTAVDQVYQLHVIYTNNHFTSPQLQIQSFYPDNHLYKTVLTDEHGITTETYTEVTTGRSVLTRKEGLDTYTVYDDYGNVIYVIPPKVTLNNGVSTTELNELCYQYIYNTTGQLLESKEPSKGWQYTVYNNLGQPILVQSALLKETNQWLFTKYDYFGRVTYTGLYTDARAREVIQEERYGVALQNQYEESTTRATGGFSEDLYYTNRIFPTQNIELHSINYYDTYQFLGANPHPKAIAPQEVYGLTITNNTQDLATGSKERILGTNQWITAVSYYDDKARGLYTFSENPYLETVDVVKLHLDDFTSRLIKSRSYHKKGTHEEIVTLQRFTYDRTGRLLNEKQCIGNDSLSDFCGADQDVPNEIHISSSNAAPTPSGGAIVARNQIHIQPEFTFTATPGNGMTLSLLGGNGTNTSSNPQAEVVAVNHYNELGQVVTKDVGNTIENPLQQVDYTYNLRGWLTQINDVDNLGDDLFAYSVNYNQTALNGSQALYNGNISETHWKTASQAHKKYSYQFNYDNHNRLTKATYFDAGLQQTTFSEEMSYDANGNIMQLQRTGKTHMMDQLSYTYTPESNLLASVTDASDRTTGFKEGTPTSEPDYLYDVDGNMITDNNKQISNIAYNHLNLPTLITTNRGTIEMIYSAGGAKLARITQPTGQPQKTKEFAGAFTYETIAGQTNSEKPQFIVFSEGYIEPNTGANSNTQPYNYIYQYTDHLGNIRLSYSDTDTNGSVNASEIREEKHYYPFGLQHSYAQNDPRSGIVGRKHNYGLNGIELNQDLGIDLYEMPLRSYDPTIGRWTSIDPVIHYNYSTFSAFDNNPVFWSDPSGADATAFIEHYWELAQESDDEYIRYEAGQTTSFESITKGNEFGLDDASRTFSELGTGKSETFGEGVFDVLNAGSGIGTGFQANSNIVPLLVSQRTNGTSVLSDLSKERTNGLSYSIGDQSEIKDFASVFEFSVANTNTGGGFGIEFGLDVFRDQGGVRVALHTLHQRKESLNFTNEFSRLGLDLNDRDFLVSIHSHKGGSIRPSLDVTDKNGNIIGGDINSFRDQISSGRRFKNLSKFTYRPPTRTSSAVLNLFVNHGNLDKRFLKRGFGRIQTGDNSLKKTTLFNQLKKYGHF